MIGEITPLVKVAGRMTWLRATAAHVLGATASAALLGLILGAVSSLLAPSPRPMVTSLVLGALLLASGARDAGLLRVALPSLTRQTPCWYRRHFAPTWYALLWGIDLGQGWTTRVLYTGYYALIAWVVLAPEPLMNAVIMGCYGLARGLPVLVAGLFGAHQGFERVVRWPVFRQSIFQAADALVLSLLATWFWAQALLS